MFLITLLSMSSYLCVYQQMLSHPLIMRLYQGYLIDSIKFTCMQFSRYNLWLMFYQSFKRKTFFLLKSLVKPAIFLTALPCWCRLHGSDHAVLSHQAPPVFFFWSGAHLLSHAVSSAVPSAAWVLTVVFGMGTGVSPKRIDARNIVIQLWVSILITQQ